MTRIRKPAVAGTFYPEDAKVLREMVLSFLSPPRDRISGLVGLIVPHAGYVYSGAIAGVGFSLLLPRAEEIKHVALIGPSHFVPFSGLALSSASVFQTPLGDIPVQYPKEVADFEFVSILDEAHQEEHALEVELPFLQLTLKNFTIAPICVGDSRPDAIAKVLQLFRGSNSLIVISSDLSHYHDYDKARILDRETATIIEELRIEDLQPKRACGALPIQGMLALAREVGLVCRTLVLANSGDTAGDRSRVVGYGAFEFKA